MSTEFQVTRPSLDDFVSLGFETRYCYQMDGLDVLVLGHNYVPSGGPGSVHFFTEM